MEQKPEFPQAAQAAQAPLSPQDERTWAMLAHLSILANLVTGLLGTVAALVIYLIYKDRSRYVAYQSLQSLLFQIITWILGGTLIAILWTITGLLSTIIIGICLIPIAAIFSLIPFAALIYGIIAGVKCNSGEDFKYWLIGDWVRKTYEPDIQV